MLLATSSIYSMGDPCRNPFMDLRHLLRPDAESRRDEV